MLKEFNMEEIHQFSTQSACLQNVSLSETEGRGAKKKKQLTEGNGERVGYFDGKRRPRNFIRLKLCSKYSQTGSEKRWNDDGTFQN